MVASVLVSVVMTEEEDEIPVSGVELSAEESDEDEEGKDIVSDGAVKDELGRARDSEDVDGLEDVKVLDWL